MFFPGNLEVFGEFKIISITINDINGYLISEVMTTSTNQAIISNIYISEILTTNANARVLNNMQFFAENIALLGQNNVIECKYFVTYILFQLFFYSSILKP